MYIFSNGCFFYNLCRYPWILYRSHFRNKKNESEKLIMENIKMVSPWIGYYKEIESLFQEDSTVKVKYDDSKNTIKLYVEDEEKADALAQLLPNRKVFGNITVNIDVIPANKVETPKIDLFRKAFEGNGAVAFIETVDNVSSNAFHFVVFQPEIVQYYNDDLSDINGLRSTLYQDIAKEIFGEREGIYFCTDKMELS